MFYILWQGLEIVYTWTLKFCLRGFHIRLKDAYFLCCSYDQLVEFDILFLYITWYFKYVPGNVSMSSP